MKHNGDIKNVLFIAYGVPLRTASTRLRLAQYIEAIPPEQVHHYTLFPPQKGKIQYYTRLFSRILWADTVFVQKKLIRKGWVNLIKGMKKKLIYDFDDAVYDPEFLDNPKKRVYLLSRFHHLLNRADKVLVGNAYLARYARSYNPQVKIIPTAIPVADFPLRHPREDSEDVVIGWTGSGNNHYRNLALIRDAIRKIDQDHTNIRWKIIGTQNNPTINNIFENLQNPVESYAWEQPSRIPELLKDVDIGLMPLEESEFNRGKCPTKVYEYLSMGIVPVVSSIGLNMEIIRNGENGFLADKPQDWVELISRLIQDKQLRKSCLNNGRKQVEEQFSKDKVFPLFLEEIISV